MPLHLLYSMDTGSLNAHQAEFARLAQESRSALSECQGAAACGCRGLFAVCIACTDSVYYIMYIENRL